MRGFAVQPTAESQPPYGAVSINTYLNGEGLDQMVDEVRSGLRRQPKELPPKYLYDERGSELFDQITALPEYYPTRCERAILNRNAPQIVSQSGAEELVELGSGSASKTRALLYAMAGAGVLRRYVPIDVSEFYVQRCAEELADVFPGLAVHGLVADFEHHLVHIPRGRRRLFAFLGGTIGNLDPTKRRHMLTGLRGLLGPQDFLLIGTDLVKEIAVLEAAYNDSAGVTAQFNRNILYAINSALGADFDPESFEHVAFFDRASSWIEMRLRSRTRQQVAIPAADLEVTFAAGEELRTEISTKFTERQIRDELAACGLELERFFTDEAGYFGLSLARARVG